MKIFTSSTQFDWFKVASEAEGVQSVIRENQYGKKFFTLYGNTFPIKDKLKDMGFRFFKGTWGIAVEAMNDAIKNQLTGLGVDISLLSMQPEPTPAIPVTPTDVQPVSGEVPAETEPKKPEKPEEAPSEVTKELQNMKFGVDLAMKEKGSEKIKGLMSFVERMIERVAQMTDEAAKSEFVKSFMQFAAKFHGYSFHNQMLIWVQNPQATYVKGFKQWMELGREVTNWDKGINIIAPMSKKVMVEGEPTSNGAPGEAQQVTRRFFGTVQVYDIGDTQPIPGWEKMKGDVVEDMGHRRFSLYQLYQPSNGKTVRFLTINHLVLSHSKYIPHSRKYIHRGYTPDYIPQQENRPTPTYLSI